MECASARSPLWLPQPRNSLQCSPDIWDPSPTPPPLPASPPHPKFDCAPFWDDVLCMLRSSCVMWMYGCHKWICIWKRTLSDAASEMTAQSSAGVWVNTLQLIHSLLACFRKLNNKEATSSPAYFNLPGLTPSSSIPTSPYPLPVLSTHIYAHT